MAMAHLNRSRIRRQVLLILASQLFAFVVLGGPLLATGRLVNDRFSHYSFFRDALHSLNVYGEFPWWNPSIRAGFPFYYIEFLLWPGREPSRDRNGGLAGRSRGPHDRVVLRARLRGSSLVRG